MNRKPIFVLLILLAAGSGWFHTPAAHAKEPSCEKKATSLTREGQLDQGIEAIRQCIKNDPSRAKTHVILGYLLLEKGAAGEALSSFDKALELRPRSSDAKTGKGIILSQKGETEAAETLLKDALKLNPDPARTFYELGLIYEQLGDNEQALSHFKQGITSYKQDR